MKVSWISARSCAVGFLCALLTACALPERVRDTFEADLKRCEALRGEASPGLHGTVFGSPRVDGKAYRHFFDQRIRSIEGEGILFASCHGAIACTDSSGKLRLSTRYTDSGLPQILRISFLLHEARHAEGWRHTRCPKSAPDSTPFQAADLRGADECDDSKLGPYGIQFIWLTSIARHCADCTDEERKQARDYAEFVSRLVQDNPIETKP